MGLGGRTVDLVGEDQLGEERPFAELELATAPPLLLDDDVGADDVGGHKVGGELDPRELQVQDRREGPDQVGFAQARHALQQAVPAGEDARQDAVDNLLVTDDRLGDLGLEALVLGAELLRLSLDLLW